MGRVVGAVVWIAANVLLAAAGSFAVLLGSMAADPCASGGCALGLVSASLVVVPVVGAAVTVGSAIAVGVRAPRGRRLWPVPAIGTGVIVLAVVVAAVLIAAGVSGANG